MLIYTDGCCNKGVTTYSVVKQMGLGQFEVIIDVGCSDNVGVFAVEIGAVKATISSAIKNLVKAIVWKS